MLFYVNLIYIVLNLIIFLLPYFCFIFLDPTGAPVDKECKVTEPPTLMPVTDTGDMSGMHPTATPVLTVPTQPVMTHFDDDDYMAGMRTGHPTQSPAGDITDSPDHDHNIHHGDSYRPTLMTTAKPTMTPGMVMVTDTPTHMIDVLPGGRTYSPSAVPTEFCEEGSGSPTQMPSVCGDEMLTPTAKPSFRKHHHCDKCHEKKHHGGHHGDHHLHE